MRTMHTNTSWQLSFLLDHFFSQRWCGSHFSVPGFGIMQARVFLFTFPLELFLILRGLGNLLRAEIEALFVTVSLL